MPTVTIDTLYGPSETEALSRRRWDQFNQWSLRCRNTLHYMADLILNDSEMAEHAVQICWHKASRNLHAFESEGEFRGWIMRVLIDETLTVSREVFKPFR